MCITDSTLALELCRQLVLPFTVKENPTKEEISSEWTLFSNQPSEKKDATLIEEYLKEFVLEQF